VVLDLQARASLDPSILSRARSVTDSSTGKVGPAIEQAPFYAGLVLPTEKFHPPGVLQKHQFTRAIT
jgi:hypothetical protein